MSLDSASYLTRVNAVSPYARVSYNVGETSVVRAAFSSGTQPESLLVNPREISSNELNQDLAALAMLPRLSRRDDQLRMELSDRWEVGYETVQGSRKIAVSAFREDIRNGTATLVGDNSAFGGSQAIPDFDSHNQIIDIGNYQRNGAAVGISQSLGRSSGSGDFRRRGRRSGRPFPRNSDRRSVPGGRHAAQDQSSLGHRAR